MTTQPPQSLPSFAQAFSAPSLSRISNASNALPPIHNNRSPPFDHDRRSPSVHDSPQTSNMEPRQNTRKRIHAESSMQGNDNSSESDGRRSPRIVRIKQEADYDTLPSSQTKSALQPQDAQHITDPPQPSASKRRRVTISGISHPINTDVTAPSSDPNKSISPVVMGFTIGRDDPAALEQVRSMLTVKQKQKELIEQRRGSTAGIVSTATPSVNVVNAPPPGDDRQAPPKVYPPGRAGGRSPNLPVGIAAPRRSIVANAPPISPLPRQPSPASHPAPGQPPPLPLPVPPDTQAPGGPLPNALPPPPISFAHRRARRQIGGAKGKPADIMISPRDPLHDNLQPVIQSAPAIPRAGPNQGLTGRFTSMTLPSIPPVMGPGQSTQRLMSSRVPPTPTRLGMPRNTTGHVNVGSISGRSPPSASVPIATTLVPPTPSSLHHPGYSGEKSAFLAPFEMFYDALADSKQLKNWLGEQLQKSQALTVSLQRQQEQLDETVSALVERKVAAMREEVYGLHRRVEELEQALRATRPSQSFSPNMPGAKGKTKANGVPPAPVAPETYTFPPADHTLRRTEPSRRMLSPMQVEKDGESRSFPGSQTSSPVPFDVGRRLSVSAIRLDPRSPPSETIQRASFSTHSSSYTSRERESLSHGLAPPPPGARAGWSPGAPRAGVPSTSARASLSHPHPSHSAERTRRASVQRPPVDRDQYSYWEGKEASEAGGDGRSEGVSAPRRESGAVVSPSPPSDEE